MGGVRMWGTVWHGFMGCPSAAQPQTGLGNVWAGGQSQAGGAGGLCLAFTCPLSPFRLSILGLFPGGGGREGRAVGEDRGSAVWGGLCKVFAA